MRRVGQSSEHAGGPGVDHAALVLALQQPALWRPLGVQAAPGEKVLALQTHRSWIFMLGDVALKLKKPLRDDCVDFRGVEQRAHFCAEELRLNARLAPQVYRGLVAVLPEVSPAEGPAGVPAEVSAGAADLSAVQSVSSVPSAPSAPSGVAHRGRTVRLCALPPVDADQAHRQHPAALDWLVQMRRLPAARMLDRLIVAGRIRSADLDRLAEVLVGFWAQAPRAADPGRCAARFQSEWQRSHEVLCGANPPAGLHLPAAQPALDRLSRLLLAHEPLLEERALSGHLLDGHGDLRPEHVHIPEPPAAPCVIDALEFDEQLRACDPFDELALLKLECSRLGAGWVGDELLARCARGLGDIAPAPLMQLYAVNRAVLRARLSLLHLADPAPREPARWAPLASWYLACALQA